MSGTKAGFSLLELLVVLLIIGLLGTIVIPNLQIRAPGYERQEFLASIQGLIGTAWQQVLKTGTLHRLFFDFKKSEIRLEQIVKTEQFGGEKEEGKLVELPYIKTQLAIPPAVAIKQLFIDGTDVLNQPGVKVETAWFYMVPEGLSQAVVINLVDTRDTDEKGQPTRFGLTVNPLTAHVNLYENFVQP